MKENTVSGKSNDIVTVENSMPTTAINTQPAVYKSGNYEPAYGKQIGQMMSEAVAGMKADRINTNRAVSAEIASNARVQNQNDRYITVCEQELRRKDLSEERRKELIDSIRDAKSSSEKSASDSKVFIKEQLDHSHKQPLKIIGIAAVAALTIGVMAIVKAA